MMIKPQKRSNSLFSLVLFLIHQGMTILILMWTKNSCSGAIKNYVDLQYTVLYHRRCSIIGICLLLIFLLSISHITYSNVLDNEYNSFSNKRTLSQIKEPEENIINQRNVQVREKDGILQSDEQEIIELFDKNDIDEKIDYTHCASYYKQASMNIGHGIYAIKLKSGEIIGYSKTRPKSKNILKYDPFIGLFLMSGAVDSKYSYEIADIDEYALSRELASVGIRGANAGRFQSHQSGFLEYAQFSVPTQKNGVISNICYKIYGLSVGEHGFIEKKYIDRFLSQERPYYGDIGVRFEVLDEESATFGVQFADPFFPNNPFKRGDVLISINDIAPRNWADLELLVADLPFNETARIKIRRGEDIKQVTVKVGKRYGGMLLADSFLERFNFHISNDFVVERVPSRGPFSKLRKGDRILFVNNVDMRQFKPKNTAERNALFQELFTRIQGNQVDFLEQKMLEQEQKDFTKKANVDILEQFQSKGSTQDRKNSFYRKMSENMDKFINGEMSVARGGIPTLNNQTENRDLHSFSGDGILRDSGTQSMRTIYDIYDYDANRDIAPPKKERIRDYEELVEYGGQMNFLIDRQGFQFRVPLE